MLRSLSLCLLVGGMALGAQLHAAPAAPVMHPDMSLEAANRLLGAAMQACHAQGKTLAAAVVDRGGNLMALQRDERVGPHNTLAAQRKAFTALSTKTSTRQLADNARANPQAQNLNTVGELLLLGGGLPIAIGSEVIGAIGVAGAGGADGDEACAAAAIAQVLPAYSH
jgi:uncharacterized protein GlcG (DUF336 family)